MTASSKRGRFPRTLAVRIELYEASFQMVARPRAELQCDARFRSMIGVEKSYLQYGTEVSTRLNRPTVYCRIS